MNENVGTQPEPKETKPCSQCLLPKSLAEFPEDKQRRTGRRAWCKLCCKAWREKQKFSQKEIRLNRDFDLSLSDWQKIYDYQNGLCGFCHKPLPGFFTPGGKTAVDHCHKTGLIRGLLHRWPCNRLLGFLRDDPTLCRFAADYLEHPPAVDALGGPRLAAPGQVGSKKRRRLIKRLLKQRKRKLLTFS